MHALPRPLLHRDLKVSTTHYAANARLRMFCHIRTASRQVHNVQHHWFSSCATLDQRHSLPHILLPPKQKPTPSPWISTSILPCSIEVLKWWSQCLAGLSDSQVVSNGVLPTDIRRVGSGSSLVQTLLLHHAIRRARHSCYCQRKVHLPTIPSLLATHSTSHCIDARRASNPPSQCIRCPQAGTRHE